MLSIFITMGNKFIKSFFFISILLIGCTRDETKDVLLQVGKFQFTNADFDMIKVRNHNQPVSHQQKDNLVRNAYILAFALDNRYDTIQLLNKKLTYGMRLYSSEVDGFVWNRKVKPNLQVSENEIMDAYQKRSAAYTLDCIVFPKGSKIDPSLSDGTKLNTEKGFYAMKQNVASVSGVSTGMMQSSYPFYPISIYSNKMISAQKGDVIGPFDTPNGLYIVYVADIKPVKQAEYKDVKPVIERELLNIKSESFIQESQKEILGKTKPKMYDSEILYMASKFDPQTRTWSGIDGGKVLMDYQFKGEKQSFTAASMVELLQCEPVLMGSASDAKVLKEWMANYLMDIYLFEEAKNMGAETNQEFLSFKRYYQNKLFLQYFNDLYIYPKLAVSPSEAQQFYIRNKTSFKAFESATLAEYQFKDMQSAYNGMNKIKEFYEQGNSKIQLSHLPDMLSFAEKTISALDTTHQANLIIEISDAKVGQTLMPQKNGEQYSVIYLKDKKGEVTLPYKYAKIKIERILPEKKMKDAYELQMASLKAKYRLTINNLKH